MGKKIYTNWTEATTNVSKAFMGLLHAIDSGYEAWLEIQDNGKQDYPVKIVNPTLDNPFNWTSYIGVPRDFKAILDHKYINDTEKDLTVNWIDCFGTLEAIEHYQKTGELIDGAINSCGRSHPVRIKDANNYRKNKDGYEYGFWMNWWKPKDEVPYWIPDPNIKKVFVVCTYGKNSLLDKQEAIKKAGKFLTQYANMIGG
jgi:hypothetical protein